MKRTPLRRIGKKRAAELAAGTYKPKPRKPLKPFGKRAMRQREKPRAMDAPQNERHCELSPYLEPVLTWQGYQAGGWNGKSMAIVDRHHMWNQQRHQDEPWLVVWASRLAHDFCHHCQPIGKLVCTYALHRLGRYDAEKAYASLGCHPVGFISNWLENGEYAGESELLRYARELIETYGTRNQETTR